MLIKDSRSGHLSCPRQADIKCCIRFTMRKFSGSFENTLLRYVQLSSNVPVSPRVLIFKVLFYCQTVQTTCGYMLLTCRYLQWDNLPSLPCPSLWQLSDIQRHIFIHICLISGWTADRAPGDAGFRPYQGATESAEAQRCGPGRCFWPPWQKAEFCPRTIWWKRLWALVWVGAPLTTQCNRGQSAPPGFDM